MQLGLQPSLTDVILYALMVACAVMIHYSAMVIITSLSFWITNTQGLESGYFTLFEFSRLPRQAFKGITRFVFVWALPVVVVTNIPAEILIHGFNFTDTLWFAGVTVFWFGLAVIIFHRGIRRYSSASS